MPSEPSGNPGELPITREELAEMKRAVSSATPPTHVVAYDMITRLITAYEALAEQPMVEDLINVLELFIQREHEVIGGDPESPFAVDTALIEQANKAIAAARAHWKESHA